MHKMSNLEYSFMAGELSRALSGKHFSRIRKVGEAYRMKIAGIEILCEPGVRIHATKYIEPATADKFTEKVEKELDNSRLVEVRQVNRDRILSFVFERGELVFEMFGTGNIILVREGKTVCAHRYESWSDREIKAGADYSPPKASPAGGLELSGKFVIVSLMRLPLGKEYALEALARCGIDEKTPGDSLSGNRLLGLESEVKKLADEAKPYLFLRDGRPADFALARLSKYSSLEAREEGSLSEAADEYYSHLEQPNPRLDKLQERLSKQKERMLELSAEEKENRSKGDYLYEHYAEAEAAISLARDGPPAEMEAKGWKMDKKEKTVELDI